MSTNVLRASACAIARVASSVATPAAAAPSATRRVIGWSDIAPSRFIASSLRWAKLRQDRREARHVAPDMRVEIAKPDIGRHNTLLTHFGLDVRLLAPI